MNHSVQSVIFLEAVNDIKNKFSKIELGLEIVGYMKTSGKPQYRSMIFFSLDMDFFKLSYFDSLPHMYVHIFLNLICRTKFRP